MKRKIYSLHFIVDGSKAISLTFSLCILLVRLCVFESVQWRSCIARDVSTEKWFLYFISFAFSCSLHFLAWFATLPLFHAGTHRLLLDRSISSVGPTATQKKILRTNDGRIETEEKNATSEMNFHRWLWINNWSVTKRWKKYKKKSKWKSIKNVACVTLCRPLHVAERKEPTGEI